VALPCGARDEGMQASAEQRRAGMVLFRRSVLERVNPETRPDDDESIGSVSLQATLGEYEAVQLGVLPLRDLRQLRVVPGDLTDGVGHVLPAAAIDVRMVRFYNQPVAISVKNRWAVVPKTLEPAPPIDLDRGQVRPYWITVHVPADQPGGEYRGVIHFEHDRGETTMPLALEVIPVHLDDPDILYAPICMSVVANLWKTLPNTAGTPEPGDSLMAKALRRERITRDADLVFADLRAHGMTGISLRSGSA